MGRAGSAGAPAVAMLGNPHWRVGAALCIPETTSLPTDKSEASPAPGPLADPGPADAAPALDCLSQEVQDSFSFLEDSSSSEPEWVGAEDGEVAKAGAAGAAFSPGEDDPGIGYLEELLGVGPQVRGCAGFGVVRSLEGRQDPLVLTHSAVPTGGGVLSGAAPG